MSGEPWGEWTPRNQWASVTYQDGCSWNVLTNWQWFSQTSSTSRCGTIMPKPRVPKNPTISSLSDYRPVALTPIMMKCFERLVKDHTVSRPKPKFDPYQFAYWPKHSTEDAISSALHPSLAWNTHVRMLLLDLSSAFNTIIPQHLVSKLAPLGFPLCNWLFELLTDRPQPVGVGRCSGRWHLHLHY